MIRLVDCRDSFTWNLVHLFRGLGAEMEVLPVDRPLEELAAPGPRAWILSPGPGRPSSWPNLPPLLEAIPETAPLLGVCLGHQAIGEAFGARLRRIAPRHGKTSGIRDLVGPLMGTLKEDFPAMRYHSLGLDPEHCPPPLRWTARGPEGEVMGLEVVGRPWFGLQFHPESILTPGGVQIARAFLEIVSEKLSWK